MVINSQIFTKLSTIVHYSVLCFFIFFTIDITFGTHTVLFSKTKNMYTFLRMYGEFHPKLHLSGFLVSTSPNFGTT